MGGGELAAEAALRQTLAIASASSTSDGSTNGDPEVTKSESRTGGDRQVSMESSAVLEKEISGVGFGGALLHLLRVGSISPLYVIQVQTMPRRGAISRELWSNLDSVSFVLYRLPPRQIYTVSDKHASSPTVGYAGVARLLEEFGRV